jgi:hypothetical protein
MSFIIKEHIYKTGVGKMRIKLIKLFIAVLLAFSWTSTATFAEEEEKPVSITLHKEKQVALTVKVQPNEKPRFKYPTEYNFTYPDAVRGIYVTSHSAGGSRFETLLNLVNTTDLNAMVIDIKDDWGNLTYKPEENSPYYSISQNYIKDVKEMLNVLEENEIYPIARIVVFKDSVLAKNKPEYSYLEDGEVWTNRNSEAFVNPFIKEVWDYNVNIAIEAAKLGFKEIQFDYVRFPEGFQWRDEILEYGMGDYEELDMDNVQKRVQAVTDFVAYANKKLEYYDVDVSVDIFGYSATISEAPGIGQNFSKISEEVDVISSMIYPSHWTSYFGIAKPDLEPYRLVTEYIKVEKERLAELESPPTSRPWLQDFTAKYLGAGNYKVYGIEEVEAQIRALNEQGVFEFLLWDAGNTYTEGVDYTPLD